MIRVVVVDDHPAFLQGVVGILDRDREIEVVATADSVEEARGVLEEVSPDLVVLDLRLSGGDDGTDLAEELCDSDVRVLVLSQFTVDHKVMGALEAGVDGYAVKEISPEKLRGAVHTVMSGRMYLDPPVTKTVVDAMAKAKERREQRARKAASAGDPFGLSRQERRVVRLLPQGLSNREIAERLGVSHDTVKAQLREALRKLGVDDRRAAARIVLERGIGS